MDEEWFQLWGRINAHEFLIEQLFALKVMEDPDPVASAKATAANAKELAQIGFAPGTDPAIADALSAATEEAIEDIMRKVVERVESAV